MALPLALRMLVVAKVSFLLRMLVQTRPETPDKNIVE